MQLETKIKICLYKRYFDTGLGLTNYAKYFLVLFAFASRDIITTMVMATAYGIACFFMGWAWLNSEFYKADTELTNRYNIFVDEVRLKLLSKA